MVGGAAQSVGDHPSGPWKMALTAFFGVGYILTSAGMISFNKYLINKDRFPYAIVLVFLHNVFCSVVAATLRLIKPSWFPSLTDPDVSKRVVVDRHIILKGCLPIAIQISIFLVLSNSAYIHSSVSFLQMMKEANLVLVYIMSVCLAMEKFLWRSVVLIVLIMAATTMTIHGEIHFSWTGFTMQAVGQIFESAKIVLQAVLLSGWKLDALSYMLLVPPLCAMVLGVEMLFLVFVYPIEHFAVPTLWNVLAWSPYLLASSCLAFMLNTVVALFVKNSSAIAYILAGLVKDAAIVGAGVYVLREATSVQQVTGFVLQLSLVFLWSLCKTYPKIFERGFHIGLWLVVTGRAAEEEEKEKKALAGQQPAGYGAAGAKV